MFKEILFQGKDWIPLAQNKVQQQDLASKLMNIWFRRSGNYWSASQRQGPVSTPGPRVRFMVN
jgi:hypothetical protein